MKKTEQEKRIKTIQHLKKSIFYLEAAREYCAGLGDIECRLKESLRKLGCDNPYNKDNLFNED